MTHYHLSTTTIVYDYMNSSQLLPKPIIVSTSLATISSISTPSHYIICIVATYHLLIVTPLYYQATTLWHCTSSFITCDFAYYTAPHCCDSSVSLAFLDYSHFRHFQHTFSHMQLYSHICPVPFHDMLFLSILMQLFTKLPFFVCSTFILRFTSPNVFFICSCTTSIHIHHLSHAFPFVP